MPYCLQLGTQPSFRRSLGRAGRLVQRDFVRPTPIFIRQCAIAFGSELPVVRVVTAAHRRAATIAQVPLRVFLSVSASPRDASNVPCLNDNLGVSESGPHTSFKKRLFAFYGTCTSWSRAIPLGAGFQKKMWFSPRNKRFSFLLFFSCVI